MPRYTWNWSYRSNLATGVAGETADMPDELAEAVNRDSPGALSPVAEKPAKAAEPAQDERSLDEAPKDRMKRSPDHKRGGGN